MSQQRPPSRKPRSGERPPRQGHEDRPSRPVSPSMAEETTTREQFEHIEGAHYLFGRHAVLEVLETQANRVQKLFVAENAPMDRRLERIVTLAEQAGIRWQHVPRLKIDGIVRQHAELYPEDEANLHPSVAQGVAVLVNARPLLELDALIASLKATPLPFLIALDEVMDARNIGAILRVADAAGAHGVILPKHRSGTLSPLASKTAVGADQHLAIAQVTNLGQALETLQEAGYWVVGSLCETDKEDPFAVQPYRKVKYNSPTVLVLGSEEKGLRPNIARRCDFKVTIPQYGQVQSLNVSTAAAVLAFEIAHQHQAILAERATPTHASS
jgi:23S rRNA (guanosine2251-2'-O)-methyltransferase